MTDDTEGRSRLVVELTPAGTGDLHHLLEVEGVNKTTIVNRALGLYRLIRDILRGGGRVYVQEPGSDELQRLLLL